MNKTIWKYPLEIEDNQSVELPIDAEILTVQTVKDKPYLWALVNPDGKTETRFIEIFGTGHPVGYDMGISRKYISTFQLAEGRLIFHVFEYTGV